MQRASPAGDCGADERSVSGPRRSSLVTTVARADRIRTARRAALRRAHCRRRARPFTFSHLRRPHRARHGRHLSDSREATSLGARVARRPRPSPHPSDSKTEQGRAHHVPTCLGSFGAGPGGDEMCWPLHNPAERSVSWRPAGEVSWRFGHQAARGSVALHWRQVRRGRQVTGARRVAKGRAVPPLDRHDETATDDLDDVDMCAIRPIYSTTGAVVPLAGAELRKG